MNNNENNNQINMSAGQGQPMPNNGIPQPITPTPVAQEPVTNPGLFANENSVPTPVAPVNPTPIAPVTPAAPSPTVAPVVPTPQVEVSAPVSNDEVTVINNTKSKGGGFAVIIIIGLIILFIFNIDKVIELYERYTTTGTLTEVKDDNTNNLTGGYLLIDDNSSNITVEDIKFYSFAKSSNTLINFSYVASKKISDVNASNIYVEIYNADKKLLYREQFLPKDVVEKDTVRTYSLTVDADVYEGAFYALVKVIDPNLQKTVTQLTCTYSDSDDQVSVSYKNIYEFSNDELIKYTVNKTATIKAIDSESSIDYSSNKFISEIKKENDDLSTAITTKYENNSLEYTVDLSNDVTKFIPLYSKGTTSVRIKNKEELKKWICE